ncbi:hypothetical protein MKZ38_000096 [Zalerion maritima]|uniref:Nephrocystin 3-like N-terminal domain-containing protein n=1 Tax=Zalerion maritima TaxID=339359 RepID=A0AAD5WS98_9PEZI|nr:hypothetical protein MKZ38_000096 [Zalerion maritima]
MSESQSRSNSQASRESENNSTRSPDGSRSETSAIPYGTSHEGLVFDFLGGYLGDDDNPNIDVVEVLGVCHKSRLSVSEICGYNKGQRRSFSFGCNPESFLAGEMTAKFVESQAIALLKGLASFRKPEYNGPTPIPRPVVFVAYDLGSVVLKKAFSIAMLSPYNEWPDICASGAPIVFHGCPQRSVDSLSMEAILWHFLRKQKTQKWRPLVTHWSVHELAKAVMETNDLFLSTKTTFHRRIISLIADSEEPQKINKVFDRFTGTLGVPFEIFLADKELGSLPDRVYDDSHKWRLDPKWAKVHQTLSSASAPHRKSRFGVSEPKHPVLRSNVHKKWSVEPGHKLLYVHGNDAKDVRELSGQIYLSWQNEQRAKWVTFRERIFSFHFDSRDPQRDSIRDMVSTFLADSYPTASCHDLDNDDYRLWSELFADKNGGVTDEHLRLFFQEEKAPFIGTGTLLFLEDLDECEDQSRKAFLDMFSNMGDESEDHLKILVTSRKRGALLGELKEDWSVIDVDYFSVQRKSQHGGVDFASDSSEGDKQSPPPSASGAASDDGGDEPGDDSDSDSSASDSSYLRYSLSGSLTKLCPASEGDFASRIRTCIDGKLSEMDIDMRNETIGFLQDHTGWPTEPSPESLSSFTTYLELMERDSTIKDAINVVLRAAPDQTKLRSVLRFLLCGYRPLTLSELISALSHDKGGSPESKKEVLHLLHKSLRGLLDFNNNQVTIRTDIWELLRVEGVEGYLWQDARSDAHPSLLAACLGQLEDEAAQARMKAIFTIYESAVESAKGGVDDAMMPPVVPDGKDFSFYATQALAYHASRSTDGAVASLFEGLKDPTATLTGWSHTLWAMTNPFERSREPPKTAYPLLVALGLPAQEGDATGNGKAQALVEAVRRKRSHVAQDILQKKNLPAPALMDALVAAVSAADEEMALVISNQITAENKHRGTVDALKSPSTHPQWAPSLIWGAAWTGMSRLAELLLSNGVDADPVGHDSDYWASPLYFAARLGHKSTAEALVRHGASLQPLPLDSPSGSPLYMAAMQGHHGMIEILAPESERECLLEGGEQARPPLYMACVMGNWRVTEVLLRLGSDPDCGVKPDEKTDRWMPLVGACDWGHAKTAAILLEHGANPNICGPDEEDTALRWATAVSASPRCCQVLLDHGADPNHEFLKPPLMVEIAKSGPPGKNCLKMCDMMYDHKSRVEVDGQDADDGMSALMYAAMNRNIDLLKWLLEHGADVDLADQKKETAIFYAVRHRKKEAVEELLKKKPDLNILNEYGDGLLRLCISLHPMAGMLDLLLDAGADPNLVDGDGSAPLNYLAGSSEACDILVKRGADIHHKDGSGWSPIMDAVRSPYANVNTLRTLADAGADLGEAHADSGKTLLHLAASSGVDEVLPALLEYHTRIVDVNKPAKDGSTPLGAAIANDSVPNTRLLIRAGADVNARDDMGDSPVTAALVTKDSEIIDLLLSRPDININSPSRRNGGALHVACWDSDVATIDRLLALGADVNLEAASPHFTPLVAACCSLTSPARTPTIVSTLLNKKANVNAKATEDGPYYDTALCAAAMNGTSNLIRLLVDEAGALTHDPDRLDRLPIHFAAISGLPNFEALALYYPPGRDFMACDLTGRNCLHYAAQYGKAETVEFILSKIPANDVEMYVNLADADGWTPLCWAAREIMWYFGSESADYMRTIKILLENGARRDIKCQIGNGEDARTVALTQLARLLARQPPTELRLNLFMYGSEDSPPSGKEADEEDKEEQSRERGDGDDENDDDTKNKYYFGHYLICRICFGTCFEFSVCTKCHGRIDKYHGLSTTGENERHIFETDNSNPEFLEIYRPVSVPPSVRMNREPSVHGSNEDGGSEKGGESEDRASESSGENLSDLELDDIDI